jgi:hypothetical protein
MPFKGASSELGDIDMLRWPGDGVDIGEPVTEYCSPPSERGARPDRLLPMRVASAAAVAAAASSTVPV